MGLLTDSFKEKLTSTLLSSDPRMSHIRQGMLEKIGPMAGRRPIAPTFGELAAGLVSGKRQGERDYLQEELAKTELVTLDNGDLATYNKITKEFDVLQEGTAKPTNPKSYKNIETDEFRSMTASDYASLPIEERQKWLPADIELSGADIDPTGKRNFEDLMVGYTQNDINLQELDKLLQNDLTFTAAIPKTINNALSSIAANISQGFQWFEDDGETVETTEVDVLDENRGRINEIAQASGVADSLIIATAYTIAANLNPDGRISDKDFKYALESLVGKTKDKNVMRAIIQHNIKMNRKRAQNQINLANQFNRNPLNKTMGDLFPEWETTIQTETETSVPDDYDELGIL